MPTSLVTGGAGFLGSHLCEALLAKGHRVICVDNLETGTLSNIELGKFMTGKVASASASISELEESLSGRAASKDL